MNAHTTIARPQIGLPHLVAHAHAAALKRDDACRPGAAIDEAEFGALEAEAANARDRVREVVEALGVNPAMLVTVLS
jgi:hypothetical protein